MTCVQPGVAVLLDRRDAVGGRAGDRLAPVEQRVGDLRLRGQPAAPLHRLGHRPELVLLDPRQLEQRVGGAPDVLELVRQVHAGDLARAVAALVAVAAWIEATIVQPRSMSRASMFPRV